MIPQEAAAEEEGAEGRPAGAALALEDAAGKAARLQREGERRRREGRESGKVRGRYHRFLIVEEDVLRSFVGGGGWVAAGRLFDDGFCVDR